MPEFPDRRSLIRASAGLVSLAAFPRGALAHLAGGASLDAIARDKGLRFGTAVMGEALQDRQVAALIARECSVLVPENGLKWRQLEPEEGQYRLEEADAVAHFAEAHAMALRGHCFVWSHDDRIPGWLLDREEELAENGGEGLVRCLERHADMLVARYPQIGSWDVVNEMIQPHDGIVRSSLFSRILPERLLDTTFAIIRQRYPSAQLVYNDYMCWERQPHHRDGVLRLLRNALSRGVPVDALGVQAHLGYTLGRRTDARGWRAFLEQVRQMGLKVLITELDCSDVLVQGDSLAARDRKVAEHTERFLELTLPYADVEQIVTWSLTDRGSYLNRASFTDEPRRADGEPLRAHPYDEALRPKPMRKAIAEALRSAPAR